MRTLLLLLTVACAGEADNQASIDENVVYGILDAEIYLYGQYIVGTPAGGLDVTGDCPLGGTVRFAGATTADTVATLDLDVTFTDCATTGNGYDLAFTGVVSWDGSFASTGYKALASTSDALTVVGEVQSDAGTVEVDETCALGVTDRGSDGEVSVVSGEWCGRGVGF